MSFSGGIMKQVITLALSLILAASASAAPGVQHDGQSESVLVQGNPALTSGTVADVEGFFEWLFQTKFTNEQDGELQRILVRVWRKGERSEINGIGQILELKRRLEPVSEEQREQVRAELKSKMLETLHAEQVDDFSRLMLQVSENGPSATSDAHASVSSERGAGSASELLDSWRSTRISMLQYQNTITGSMTPGNGSSLSYKFFPDGRFEFAGYMQTTVYNCTTTYFNPMSGTYSVEGSRVILTPVKNVWQSRSACYPSQNKDLPGKMDVQVYSFRVKTVNGKESLCLSASDGKEACYYRE
jgi:hypothetical protein